MACLQRTFEGSNLPALVNKIMKVKAQLSDITIKSHGLMHYGCYYTSLMAFLFCFQGQFAPVKGNYSSEFKDLILAMLQRDAEARPSAIELWNNMLPEVS